jgi:hypothetical protein
MTGYFGDEMIVYKKESAVRARLGNHVLQESALLVYFRELQSK